MKKTIEFHFKGVDEDISTLPVEYMINLLSNMQDLMYFMVSAKEGKTFNRRFKASKDIKDKYIMECELPKQGCYAQTISIEDKTVPLLDAVRTEHIADDITNFLFNIREDREGYILNYFSTQKQLSKALTYVRKAFPPVDNNIYVSVNDNEKLDSREIQTKTTHIIDRLQPEIEGHMGIITGRLKSINFDERKLVIQYPITKKDLDCFYNEEIEDMLIDNRRQLIQITGNVSLNDDDTPKDISDVINIQEVDLSSISLDLICGGGVTLRFKNTLHINPTLDETEQLYKASLQELDIDVYEYTRADLESAVSEQILFLWNEYAKESDDKLTKDAILLKNKLLELIEEVK